MLRLTSAAVAASLSLAACGGGDEVSVPETYEFDSRFADGESSVSYSGQTMRHVLIEDLNRTIAGLTQYVDDAVDSGDELAAGDIEAALLFYYEFDSSVSGSEEILLTADMPMAQMTYTDISSDKDLVGKIAGNDSVTDHRDWSNEFVGWDDIETPDALVRFYFSELEAAALNRYNGVGIPQDPQGNQIAEVYVTADGLDLKQLTQKFLLGAVTLSQGLDDYLDDDVDGKGLLSPNTRDDDAPYTTLEHQWDEGFGYFGASRAYVLQSDDDIADGVVLDADDDGNINLKSEYNFGNSVNAAKRDRGSADSARTDYTQEAMDAFLRGRALIASFGDELSEAELDQLRAERDIIAGAWERAVSATIVHYINDTIADMDAIGTDGYSFSDHAKHWSEMKGFALGLQFSPHSPLSAADFATLHQLMGTSPVLEGETALADYREDLLEARAILQSAYGFVDANVESW